MMDPHHDADFAARTNRDEVARLTAEVDRLHAAIRRQAGAARTLRAATMAQVQHLQDMDRSEYVAAKTLDGERAANAILTDENERLTARVAKLEAVLRFYADPMEQRASAIDPLPDFYDELDFGAYARAALAQGQGE